MPVLLSVAGLLVIGLAALGWLRWRQEREVAGTWHSLADDSSGERFRTEMVDGLPGPARRYLLHAIEPGTPLSRSVRLTMSGAIRMNRDGDLLPMESEELLAADRGYVWRARLRMAGVPIRGHDVYVDGEGRMRWWLAGLIPVVRADGPGLSRSAAGRLLAETALFLPSMLLPSRGARWEPVDDSTAVVRLETHGEEAEITLEVDGAGRLERLTVPRWNSDPDNGPVGYLPFVSEDFEDERTFGGFTIPGRFRGGWRLGEEGEFPFFYPVIEDAEYPGASGSDPRDPRSFERHRGPGTTAQ